MAQIKPEIRALIAKKCVNEIAFCREKKQRRIVQWHKNEDLYYQNKISVSNERANVDLWEAQSFVNTFLSKINTPFSFRYVKGEEADLQAAKIANAIKDKDAKLGNWNFKAMLARKQMVIYGRYICEYHADSIDKQYQSHLTPVDVYKFHIDPSCGGLDIEKAWFLGRGGIFKTKKQIQDGIKSGIYLRKEGEQLIESIGDTAMTREDYDSQNRYVTIVSGDKSMHDVDVYSFWEWYTTYNGERYYCLITENGFCLKMCLLTDLFPTNKYPFFTVAADPDLTEFWTLWPLDRVREPIQAKAVAINQMLDNAEAINRPMRAFNVGAIKNPALLKYRKDGLVPVEKGFNVQQDIQTLPVIPLTTSIEVYDKLDNIVATQSGVTNGARGNAAEDKVGIYEGNMASAADRFALVQESEANWQARFAELYLDGLDEHLTSKFAVEMIGLEGVEYKEVTKKDIKRNKNFWVVISTAGSEMSLELTEKRNKLTFITNNKMNPLLNQKMLIEAEATIAGFNIDEIKSMLDKDYGNAELMAECARDIQDILANKNVKPNIAANTAYAQKLLDFIRDNSENLKPEVVDRLDAYFAAIQPIIMTNMTRNIDTILANEWITSMSGQALGQEGQMEEIAQVEWGTIPPQGLANTPEPIQY